MQIKINEKILSIPPHISTTWPRIVALHMKGSELIVSLQSGNIVTIPNLSPEILEAIFSYHAAYLEEHPPQLEEQPQQQMLAKNLQLNDLLEQAEPSFRLAFGSPDGMGYAMQHNPAQSNAPNLPPELLEKIGAIAKILLPEETALPTAEPSCNCFYCQIARVIHPMDQVNEVAEQAEITDTDLQFQQWNILQVGEKLFSVTNRLDETEKYRVYLGQPIGCTCGKEGCDHIVAVLRS